MPGEPSNSAAEEVKTSPPEVTKSSWSVKLYSDLGVWQWLLIVTGAIHALASGVLMPTFAILYGQIMDEFAEDDPHFAPIIWRFAIYGAVALWGTFVATYVFESLSDRELLYLRNAFFASIVRQDISWWDSEASGKLSTQIAEDITTYREGSGQKLVSMVHCTLTLFGGYIVAMIHGWELTLVCMAAFPFCYYAGKLVGKAYMFKFMGSLGAFTSAGAIAEEAVSAVRTIHAYSAQETIASKFTSAVKKAESAILSGSIRISFGLASIFFVMFGSHSLGFWYGGMKLASDNEDWIARGGEPGKCPRSECYTPYSVITIIWCCIVSMMYGFSAMSQPTQAILKASAAVARIRAVIARKPAIDSMDETTGIKLGDKPDSFTDATLEFKSVTFRYPSRADAPVYDDLSFTIDAGKTVALVGASGCGKSTAAQLLLRFFDVEGGAILLNGTNIKDLNVPWYREQIAFVTQEPRLFATSIYENIRNGKPDATEEEIIAAAKAANAHNFIMSFPDGYQTHVGQGGGQLSGGQKQRIAIARAMIRDPKILILDEATSALDNESERVVQDALDRLLRSKPRTTLVIAHRLSTIRRADKIVVLGKNQTGDSTSSGSRVIEQGNHTELMAMDGGAYRKLVGNTLPEHSTAGAAIDSITVDIATADSVDGTALAQETGAPAESNLVPVKAVSLPPETDLPTTKQAFHALFALISGRRFMFLLGTFFAVLKGLVFPISGMIAAEVSASLIGDDIRSDTRKWAFFFLGLGVVQSVLLFGAYGSLGKVEARLTPSVRSTYFRAILKQNVPYFDKKENSTGDIITNLSSKSSAVEALVGDGYQQVVGTVSGLVLAMIVGYITSWKLALVLTATYVVFVPGSALSALFADFNFIATAAQEKASTDKEEGSAGFIMTETATNIRTVQALCMERTLIERFTKRNLSDAARSHRQSLYTAISFAIGYSTVFIGQFIAVAVGCQLVKRGEITVAEMYRVINTILTAGEGIGRSCIFVRTQLTGIRATKDILALSATPTLIDPAASLPVVLANPRRTFPALKPAAMPAVEDKDISFNSVRFAYPQRQDAPIFGGVTLTIPAGKVTALVGTSGCGKSTIVQLLERFYEITDNSKVSAGTITIGGTDLREMDVQGLRSQIGLVSQEPVLFTGTLAENIALGARPDQIVSQEEIENAASLSNALTFIAQDLPDGFETRTGVNGSQLSGGQKQRIAIARALIRNPGVLILDEATSALDNESEKIVQQALDTLLSNTKTTTIVIAHRLSTIRNADNIIVFSGTPSSGSFVAETGTHNELMAKPDGVYRALVAISQGEGESKSSN